MEVVQGYKCFNKNHTNRHGVLFEEGKTYTTKGEISFGNSSTGGYHMCKYLEDTLRYFPATEEEVSIASVTGEGKIIKRDDEYYGYFDMYSTETITINKFLEREEIIKIYLTIDNPDRVCRFIQLFRLSQDEIYLFQERYKYNNKVLKYIDYYQLNDTNAFNRKKVYKKKINSNNKNCIV